MTRRDKWRKLRYKLSEIIEPDVDFLNKLVQRKVITKKQSERICSRETAYDKNSELIEYLLTSYTGHFSKVMKALEDTGQQHVVNYVDSGGGMFVW